MPRFRKKPVEVEAWQWDPSEPHEVLRLLRSSPVKGPSFPHDDFPDFKLARFDHDGRLIFYCLKSDALCTIAAGDWVIRESDGVGYYPCTAQMFEATYDDATTAAPRTIRIVFEPVVDEHTGHDELRFIEVENDRGESINVGTWHEGDGWRWLTIDLPSVKLDPLGGVGVSRHNHGFVP